jgi:arabinose-5-phosphate isomerase
MMLALCDAVAVATFRMRQFSPQQFKTYHPGGKLGQRLTTVSEVMHSDSKSLPLATTTTELSIALEVISRCGYGCVGVVDSSGVLVGIFTDGDLRRQYANSKNETPVGLLMNTSPSTVAPTALIEELTKLFATNRIPSAFVCENGVPIGIVHIHHLIRRGFL